MNQEEYFIYISVNTEKVVNFLTYLVDSLYKKTTYTFETLMGKNG